MKKILQIVTKEIREALPATIFFLLLFHMIGLTKAVVLNEYSLTALRAAGTTMGALIVAKAILLVEALPIARFFCNRRIYQVLWKTFLYGMVALIFRILEELIPSLSKSGDFTSAVKTMQAEVSWPLFTVLALWTFGGLFLYSLTNELASAIGRDKVKRALFDLMKSG